MRRAVAVAALVLLSFLTLQAQARGGHMGGGFRGGPSMSARPATRANVVVRSQVPARTWNGGFAVAVGVRPFHYHHHYPLIYSYGYGYPYYPYYGAGFYDPSFYGGYYSGYSYDNSDYSQQTQQLSNQISSLTADIRDLRDENEELRDYITRRNEPAPYPDRSIPPSVAQPLQPQGRVASPQSPKEEGPATVLVYKDGRKVETRNYAIVGQTMWVLSDQRATKIPLSELDLDKTTQENEQRGVEFAGPPSPSPK